MMMVLTSYIYSCNLIVYNLHIIKVDVVMISRSCNSCSVVRFKNPAVSARLRNRYGLRMNKSYQRHGAADMSWIF